MRGILAWSMLAWSPAWADDCPDRSNLGTTPAVVGERLAEVEALYPVIYDELQALKELEGWVRDGMNCLTVPAPPELAARYHRFQAMATDPLGGLSPTVLARTEASLRAGLRLDPTHVLRVPEDHGHREVGLEGSGVATLGAGPPLEGAIWFDGWRR